ncbi:Formin-like protein 1 [Bagarius yarrelli]|uniref:Formin-like protein 1 n=1 Tax=Bagarius yarrelli TaxID=175774 RepID=A0A556U1G8_BAGYA|nr:Formin-like protein 1 [Bagarius yarrelli]
MGNASGGMEVSSNREVKGALNSKHPPGPKLPLPLPPDEELEERFSSVLISMNLPPDKVKLLLQYNSEKKWELICDQEFLSEENKGLDVLVEYLSFAQRAVPYDLDCTDNGSFEEKSSEDGTSSATNSPTHNSSNANHSHTARTKALVLELLAAVCFVRGGHSIILSAFNNFKEVCGERCRFEKLMAYFRNVNNNLDFMVACMQFINIVVHSVENMNFRVHLQYEFTQLGLDAYLGESLRESCFQISTLQQQEQEREMARELERERERERERLSTALEQKVQSLVERGLIQMQRSESGSVELSVIKEAGSTQLRHAGMRDKKPIQTKYRMPLFNWQTLKDEQVAGTVFTELDDENILAELDMDTFEELFKTKAQSPVTNVSTLRIKAGRKSSSKISLLEPNRAKNLAITLRKGGMDTSQICTAIETYNLKALSLDFLEQLERFIPSDYELMLIQNFERDGRSVLELSEEDRFMTQFGKIPRLAQRISTLTFMGNFGESVQLLQPVSTTYTAAHCAHFTQPNTRQSESKQLNAIIAASMSVKSSGKLKKILEIVLALGNYMNSGKRGAVYGFRLQSLDRLLDTKSTDRQQTLLHFLVSIIQEKFSTSA